MRAVAIGLPKLRRRRGPNPPRDMEASSFARILAEFVPRIPGAYAASLVDADGETVDYAGRAEPFDLKVAAAHWRIVLGEVSRLRIGPARTLIVRGAAKTFLTCALPDEYALVVLFGRRAGFAPAPRALAACIHALHVEAEWPLNEEQRTWFAVSVRCDSRSRPVHVGALGEQTHSVEVLGSVVGLTRRDRGFRVRLESGAEMTLIREPGDFWYADEPLDK